MKQKSRLMNNDFPARRNEASNAMQRRLKRSLIKPCLEAERGFLGTCLSLCCVTAAFFPCGRAAAQSVDLGQEALRGIELDSVGVAPDNNSVVVYSDLTYWNFFALRQRGWNGGDGCYTTPLPDGNTFWSFADSDFGLISENRNRKSNNNMPRNAAMIQTGEEGEESFVTLNEYVSTNPNERGLYYKGKTWLRHPDATLSQADIDNGSTDQDIFYWPGDAVVANVDGQPVLQMLAGAVNSSMTRSATALAEYYLDGELGDGHYMTLKRLTPELVPYTTNYGSCALEDDGHIYLYGEVATGGIFGGTWAVVARTQSLDLNSTWEYYINDGNDVWAWQTAAPTAAEMQRSNISSGDWTLNPSVFKYGGKYYMCTQDGVNGAVYMLKSDTPWGPFGDRHKLYAIPSEQNQTYNVFVHPQLSRTGEIVLSYNMNPDDIVYYTKGNSGEAVENTTEGFWRNYGAWGSADLYQSHFLRIFNWQSLYGVDNVGPLTDAGLASYLTAVENASIAPEAQPVRIYPTVVSSSVSIDNASEEAYAWAVTSLSGAIVRSGKAAGNTNIDMSALPPGMYVVSVRAAQGSVSAKVIKQR